MDLLAWWNLIFELPFVAAFVYVLLLATGTVAGGGGGEVDQDVDAGPEADSDFDHGIEHALVDGHEQAQISPLSQILGFLGLGKVPLSILLISFSTLWSLFGWTSNQILQRIVPYPAVFVGISVLVAGVSSLMLTRYLAKGLSRLLPSVESYGVDQEDLLGAGGDARYEITETFGEAQVRDKYGNLHQVSCRVAAGEEPIAAGSKVVLLTYKPEEKVYIAITESQFEDLVSRRG